MARMTGTKKQMREIKRMKESQKKRGKYNQGKRAADLEKKNKK